MLVFILQSKDNIINEFWFGSILYPEPRTPVCELHPFLCSHKKGTISNLFLQMERFSQISQGPGLDFEIQKLGNHSGVHSTLSRNTHMPIVRHLLNYYQARICSSYVQQT